MSGASASPRGEAGEGQPARQPAAGWQRARYLAPPEVYPAGIARGTELWVEPARRRHGTTGRLTANGAWELVPVLPSDDGPDRALEQYPTHYVNENGSTMYIGATTVELLGRGPEDFRPDVPLEEWRPG